MKIIAKINNLIDPLRHIVHKYVSPLFDLTARLYLANAFWKSAMTRWADFVNGTFNRQIFLFEFEHPVPGLSPEFAAYSALFGEMLFPILVAFGLFARLGAAGILIMALVIELTYIHSIDHILWIFLAACIFIKGPGALSLDTLIVRRVRKWDEKS